MAISSINGEPLEVNTYDIKTKVAIDSTVPSSTKTNGKAWKADTGTETSGNQYHYITYTLSDTQIVAIVSGASYGGSWPLITFYDSNEQIIDDVHASSQTFYTSKTVEIPTGAVKAIVNGDTLSPADLILAEYGTKTQYDVNREVEDAFSSFGDAIRRISASSIIVIQTEALAGNVTTGAAWNISGIPTSGSYQYAEYDFDTTYAFDDKVKVSGSSWGTQWPLITFYDSNNRLISAYGTSGNTNYTDQEVTVPSGSVSCIVNGGVGVGRPAMAVKYQKITETQEDVNARIEGELSDAGITAKKYLFIGDSYSQGYSHDGNNSGWPVYLAEYMGLNSEQYGMSRRGGASFTNASNSFKQLLMAKSATDGYTDIVVCGGFNDFNQTQATIETAISDFIDEAFNMFPSARVHVGAIGYIKQGSGESAYSNWQEVRTKIETIVIPSYQASIKYGCRYLNNVEYMLSEDGLTPTDGYHPNEAGNRAIALGIANALLTGSAPLPYNAVLRAQ